MGKLARLIYISDWNLPETWQGGIVFYAENQLDAIKDALVDFQQKNDTRAAVLMSLTYSLDQVCSVAV